LPGGGFANSAPAFLKCTFGDISICGSTAVLAAGSASAVEAPVAAHAAMTARTNQPVGQAPGA